MNKVRSINWLFFIEIVISFFGPYINNFVRAYITSNELVILIFYHVMLILPAFLYMGINRINPIKQINLRKIRPSNVVLIIIFAYLVTPLIGLINMISMMFVKNAVQDTITNVVTEHSLLLGIFAVAVIPALFEETMYRGIFYTEYKKVDLRKGILLSAFLFGLAHRNINQFVYAFIMGAIFCLLIEATGSILASMIVHFVFNANSVTLSHILDKFTAFVGMESIADTSAVILTPTDYLYQLFIVIVTTILAFIVFRTIAINSGRYEHIKGIFRGNKVRQNDYEGVPSTMFEEPNEKPRLITVPLVLGMLFCVYVMIIYEMV